ncbi:hypothetical protein D915_005303 [Fasciola hepatica]|uniref:Uncharacterized protein n=1 Tax=Fasciola hepatica TaxID=6192 RepID=A0A4E0S0X1_FASHE|nr:hypothetical protein D915_005303 [Fasciola hepatica]
MKCHYFQFFPILICIIHHSSGLTRFDSHSLFLHGYQRTANSGQRAIRNDRNFYNSDGSILDQKPQLQASHERDFTVLKCAVKNRAPNVEIYLLCPALGDRSGTGHCYQGCTPTEPCPESSHKKHNQCVPNNQTVFCEQKKFDNGTTTIEVKVDRTDPRLSGEWYCTHAGMQSARFEIGLQNPDASDAKVADKETKPKDPIVSQVIGPTETQKKYNEIDERPLAYMRKPVIMFTVVGILIISLLINMAFCVRCLIMRSYIDAQNEGASNANCLAACLCLPKGLRKMSSVRTAPVLPRSAYNQTNLNGSYHGSAGLLYPSATSTIQKVPLLLQPASQNELAGMAYYPAVSLTGTLGRQSGQRFYSTPLVQQQQQQLEQHHQSNSDGYPTPQLAYAMNMDSGGFLTQNTAPSHSQGSQPTMNEYGKPANYLPSYIRVSSVNAPSPNLSQKVLYTTNNAIIQPPQGFAADQNIALLSDGQNGTQYFVKMQQPSVLGPHVVYDDVAAGNSSIAGTQTRSPNQSLLVEQLSNTLVPLPTFYQIATAKASSAESSPNINASRIRGLPPTVRMGTGYGGELAAVPVTSDANGSGSFALPPLGNPVSSSEPNQSDRLKTSDACTPMASNSTPETYRSNTNTTESSQEPIVYSRLTGMAPLAKEVIPRISVLDSASKQQSKIQQKQQCGKNIRE